MTRPAIVATGSSVPVTVRTNDDPIFDWLHQNQPAGMDLFKGYRIRHVLAPGEQVADLMVAAAKDALTKTSLQAADIDLVLGYASVGTWNTPNDLVTVAVALGVSPNATILPMNNEYAQYHQGLSIADALIAAGRARNALVVVGTNWTRHMNYHAPPAISCGDGAGAAIVTSTADPDAWRVRDTAVSSERRYYGGMYMTGDETRPPMVPPTFENPVFHLTQLGVDGYNTFAMTGPPDLAKQIIAKHGLTPAEIAFIGHQSSSVLNDAWNAALKPKQFITTLPRFGNMTTANNAVTFDTCRDEITTAHVVLAGLGPEPSCTVLLLERG